MPIGHILMLLVEELLLGWLLVAIVVALEAACHTKVVDKERMLIYVLEDAKLSLG